MSTTKENAALPAGKTCGDCQHMERCQWLFQQKPDATECDWTPSRFLERRENDTERAL